MDMPTYVEIVREPGNPHHTTMTDVPIEGWAVLTGTVKEQFEACNGYCNLTVENGTVTAITPDEKTPNAFYATIREKEAEIAAAKDELSGSDYKVIKAYEASIAGEAAPYNMNEEIKARDALRAKINAAEDAVKAARESIDAYFADANAHRDSYK